jgi:hypothetical protein
MLCPQFSFPCACTGRKASTVLPMGRRASLADDVPVAQLLARFPRRVDLPRQFLAQLRTSCVLGLVTRGGLSLRRRL